MSTAVPAVERADTIPAVSVIIPTHDRSDFLRRAVSSVLTQTLQDFEILVIDDASSDDTTEVVNEFADHRIKYIRHDTNTGVAAARNSGILHSRGKYIAFLDDDDEWLPEKLQRQFACLESRTLSVGAVYTSSVKIDARSGQAVAKVAATLRGRIFDAVLIRGSIAPTSTFFCRRECFERVGHFEPGLRYGEDLDMWLRIAKDFDFECIDEPLVRFSAAEKHSPSLSTNYGSMIRAKETFLQKYSHLFAQHRNVHGQLYVELGVLYCHHNDMRKGRAAFRHAIRVNPFESRSYFNLCLSLLGPNAFKRLKMLKYRWQA